MGSQSCILLSSSCSSIYSVVNQRSTVTFRCNHYLSSSKRYLSRPYQHNKAFRSLYFKENKCKTNRAIYSNINGHDALNIYMLEEGNFDHRVPDSNLKVIFSYFNKRGRRRRDLNSPTIKIGNNIQFFSVPPTPQTKSTFSRLYNPSLSHQRLSPLSFSQLPQFLVTTPTLITPWENPDSKRKSNLYTAGRLQRQKTNFVNPQRFSLHSSTRLLPPFFVSTFSSTCSVTFPLRNNREFHSLPKIMNSKQPENQMGMSSSNYLGEKQHLHKLNNSKQSLSSSNLEVDGRDHNHSHDKHSDHSDRHNEHSHSHTLFGHTHTHSSADSVFVQEHGGLKNPAIRITWIGLLANLSMAIGKGIGGFIFHSQALLADSIHSLSDLISDFLTLATVSVAARPPNSAFPNGYGKIETLGSLGVSALLFLAGISVGWSGLISIIQQFFGDSHFLEIATQFLGHGHSHSHTSTPMGGIVDTISSNVESSEKNQDDHNHNITSPENFNQVVDLNAMWLALASIAIKEWLFYATMKIAKSTGSSVLIANAWHHRVDSLTSVVAVATIGGSYFFGLNWLDALGGMLVSCVIIRAGYRNGYTAALELTDNTNIVPLEIIESNTEAAKSALTQAAAHGTMKIDEFDIHNILVMSSGPNYVTQVELKTLPNMNIKKSVEVANFVEKELLAHDPRLKRVTVKYTYIDTLRQNEFSRKEKHL